LSWSICKPTLLPNPYAAIDLLKASSGVLLLAFNNSPDNRYSISIALSKDAGQTWSYLRNIDQGEGEYSYPCLIEDSHGLFHMTYTENRYRIKHFEFDLEWIEQEPLDEPLVTE
jgi:predicted neuraminidase